jgi:hypothetical protein
MKKNLFDRENALNIIVSYYQAKGYSKEHCEATAKVVPDWRIQEVARIIQEELKHEEHKGDYFL